MTETRAFVTMSLVLCLLVTGCEKKLGPKAIPPLQQIMIQTDTSATAIHDCYADTSWILLGSGNQVKWQNSLLFDVDIYFPGTSPVGINTIPVDKNGGMAGPYQLTDSALGNCRGDATGGQCYIQYIVRIRGTINSCEVSGVNYSTGIHIIP